MTQDEIIELARQAGAHDNGHEVRFVEPKYLERFAKLVSAKEREACAKEVEDASKTGKIISCMSAAAAIRARSNT